jgi:hypothetical protein
MGLTGRVEGCNMEDMNVHAGCGPELAAGAVGRVSGRSCREVRAKDRGETSSRVRDGRATLKNQSPELHPAENTFRVIPPTQTHPSPTNGEFHVDGRIRRVPRSAGAGTATSNPRHPSTAHSASRPHPHSQRLQLHPPPSGAQQAPTDPAAKLPQDRGSKKRHYSASRGREPHAAQKDVSD